MNDFEQISGLVGITAAVAIPFVAMGCWGLLMWRGHPRPVSVGVEIGSSLVSRWGVRLFLALVAVAGVAEGIDRYGWRIWLSIVLGPGAVIGIAASGTRLWGRFMQDDAPNISGAPSGLGGGTFAHSDRRVRLRPREFAAGREDPFAQDRLGRQSQVESLSRLICNVEGHSIVLVDGPWGAGKTAFVRMLAACLRSQEVRVVEFNAWQQSYTKDPLADLVAAISREVRRHGRELVNAAARLLGYAFGHAMRTASLGFIEPDAAKRKVPGRFGVWKDVDGEVAHFRAALEKAAGKWAGPLVVVVDELDRCRPDYALDLLEVVRHLFAVDGVVVVLATNRAELCHSIKGIYGDRFDTDRYLSRFADMPVVLPPPEDPDLYGYLGALLEETRLNSRFNAISHNLCPEMLRLVADAQGSSFRDLEQAIQRCAVVLGCLPHPSEDEESEEASTRFSERLAVAMIVLRTLDRDAYEGLVYRHVDMVETAVALSRTLGENTNEMDDLNSIHKGQLAVEVSLFAVMENYQLVEGELRNQPFADRYMRAFADEYEGLDLPKRARHVFGASLDLFSQGYEGSSGFYEMKRLIEMVDYGPPSEPGATTSGIESSP
ncbi:MAG: P-loop NTPase fold protein [bacterium]|nr:P-loop NTPase fold protein [bacterium]